MFSFSVPVKLQKKNLAITIQNDVLAKQKRFHFCTGLVFIQIEKIMKFINFISIKKNYFCYHLSIQIAYNNKKNSILIKSQPISGGIIMQNKLQELTEKIYKEGLEKGTEEASQIVTKAKDDASKILSDAKKQAEQIVSQAKKEVEDLKKNADTEVGISSRQVVSALKQDIARLIETSIVETPIKEGLGDAEFLKKVIETAINRWNPESTEKIDLQILIPADMEKSLSEFSKSKTFQQLNKNVTFEVDKGIKYGFKIGPQEGGYHISFTDKDFENLFRLYMRPRIIELLFGGK